MKRFQNIPTFIFLFLVSISCSPRATGVSTGENSAHPLVGTWVLISSNNSSPEGEFFVLDKSNTRQMKILNPTHFMFIQETLKGGEREFESAAGGRYELNGNTYIENLDYASWEGYEDSHAVFTWRLENGQWHHKGVLKSADGEEFIIEEIWERVDLN